MMAEGVLTGLLWILLSSGWCQKSHS